MGRRLQGRRSMVPLERRKRPRPVCPSRLAVPTKLPVGRPRTLADCSLLCAGDSGTGADAFINGEDSSIARYLVRITAITCVLLSLFTILTLIINFSRFCCPKSSIFLSTCYLAVRLAYVVWFAIRPRMTCISPFVSGEET